MSTGTYFDSALPAGILKAERKPRVAKAETESSNDLCAKAPTYNQPGVRVWETVRWKRMNWNFLIGMLMTLLVSGATWGVAIHYILRIVK
jgi:hypothetical protein